MDKMENYNFKELSKNLYPFYIPEIELSKESKLFREIISENSFSKNSLKMFNHWNDNEFDYSILDNELRSKKIKTPFGIVYFSNPKIYNPTVTISSRGVSGITVPLTPKMARNGKYTYSGEVRATLNFEPFESKKIVNPPFTLHNILLGKIPIPLGSKYCNLYGKTDQELLEMGENPIDPFTYYIIRGTEMTIVIQEKLRTQEFLYFYNNKGLLEGRFTTSSFSGTSLIVMTLDNDWPAIEVSLRHTSKDEKIPLFILFEFLGFDINKALEIILTYVADENKTIVQYGLQPSISEALSHPDYVSYFAIKRDLHKNNYDDTLRKMVDDINKDCFSDIPTTETTEEALNSYKNKLENNDIQFEPVQVPQKEKAAHLAIMAARMVEIMQGLRPIDDRNSWSDKGLTLGPKSYEQLFINMFNDVIVGAQNKVDEVLGKFDEKFKVAKNYKNIDKNNVLSIIKIDISLITELSETSFNANSWGHKGTHKKENITDTLKRDTLLSIYSQNDKIVTPANKNAPRIIREVRGSQLNAVCLTETPEGGNCGLVSHLALTVVVSLERSTDSFLKLLDQFPEIISKKKSSEFNLPLLINGRLHSWTNIDSVNFIKSQRRLGFLPRDSTIIYNINNNSIEYYCNSLRPCVPLLIVEDNELLIDKHNMWNLSLDQLYDNGVLELVDIKEQELGNVILADSPQEVRNKKDKIKSFKQNKIKLSQERKNNDIDDEEFQDLIQIYAKIYSLDTLKILIDFLLKIKDQNITDLPKYKLTLTQKDDIKAITILIKFFHDQDFEKLEHKLITIENNHDVLIKEFEK